MVGSAFLPLSMYPRRASHLQKVLGMVERDAGAGDKGGYEVLF